MWFKVIIKDWQNRVIPTIWHVADLEQLKFIHPWNLNPFYRSIVEKWEISEEEALLSSWQTFRLENISFRGYAGPE